MLNSLFKHKRGIFVSFLYFWLILNSNAQQNVVQGYTTLAHKPEDLKSYLAPFEQRYKTDIKQLPKLNHKELVEAYENRFNSIKKNIEEGHILFDKDLNQYFNIILEEIYKGNPSIPAKDIRLLISRDNIANAACYGEGTIIINIGLIRRLTNESQLAFVLCHELAHYTQNHVNKDIEQRINSFYSKESQKELQKIAQSEYHRREKALELLKGLVYNSHKHGRLFESEADSIALIYLKNTRYNLQGAIQCLEILDKADEELHELPLNLKEVFTHKDYPFKDSWLREETNSFGKNDNTPYNWNVDSLKTHPDCDKRIIALKPYITSDNSRKEFIQSETTFNTIVKTADFESVEGLYFQERLSRCLYQTLLILQQYPDNAYLHAMLGKCFHQIYIAQKNHELNRYVPMISPETQEGYKQILTFLHNLRLSEIARVNYYYIKKQDSRYLDNEDFLYAFYQAHKIMEHSEASTLKTTYLQKYPQGKYKSLIEKSN